MIINACHLPCHQPLLVVKEKFLQFKDSNYSSMIVLVNSLTAKKAIVEFGRQNGMELKINSLENDVVEIIFNKG